MVNELRPLTLSFSAPDLPPVPDIQGRLFLQILGVDPDALTTNIIVLDVMVGVVIVFAVCAMYLRLALLRGGWAT